MPGEPAGPAARAGFALRTASLLLPLLLAPPGAAAWLSPAVVYVLMEARWLVILGAVTAFFSVASAGTRGAPAALAGRAAARVERVPARGLWMVLGAAGLAVMLAGVPSHRWASTEWSGDEPKYLRLVDSLYHDLDVDVSGGHTHRPRVTDFARQLHSLARETGQALRDLVAGPGPAGDDGVRALGNWTIQGRQGGRYYVQSPGLALLLLPARWLQPHVDPGRPRSLALGTLALLWSLALVQTAKLAAEVAGSRAAGAAAGACVLLSAPLFVGGHHFYPEAAAAALVPWIARGLRPGAGPPGGARAAGLGFACGFLPWLHPKFLVLASAALALLLVKLRAAPGRAVLATAAAGLPVAALLLFDHHVTGLLRPDAFYVRYGASFYAGAASLVTPRLLTGLGTALFGARDGLLVMAPILVAAVLALPRAWRRDRAASCVVLLLFGSLWLAAAVHEGGAPGPPGRLLAPVAPLLAAPLAVGFVTLGRERSFRWTLGLLLALSMAVTWTLAGSWRRVVNPYEGMFASAASDFARDLPDGPRPPGDRPASRQRGREAARALVLAAALAFWSWSFARQRPAAPDSPSAAWRQARAFHVAAWATLTVVAALLAALRR